MKKSLSNHIRSLKTALLQLDNTGEDGFEGLMAVILSDITGVPFRLASSGSQYGVDAKPIYESDGICFEAKCYSGPVNKNEILSKIAELLVYDRVIDLWVLGATTAISSQHVDLIREFGNRNGISTLFLDWSEVNLPPLAVAIVLSEKEAIQFLERHIDDKPIVNSAQNALKLIRKHDDFDEHAKRLRLQLEEPTMGSGLFKKANFNWFVSVFSNRLKARQFLGQPLAPHDNPHSEILDRATLADSLKPYMIDIPDGKIVVVHGGEGTGKSWLVAQSWLGLDEKPLMVVITPDDLSSSNARENIEQILIRKLVVQTSDQLSDAVINRWHRQFERWRKQGTTNAPRIVVFVDGLNQRPEMDWGRMIESIGEKLDRVGGRLIVTSRTPYYQNQIKRRLVSPTTEIMVSEWSETELQNILDQQGINHANLADPIARSLRNPRLLSIALELLNTAKIENFEELNVSRLLFEHIRAVERDSPMPQPAHEFARMLQEHADDVLSRLRSQQHDDLTVFDEKLQSVAEGRFFVPMEGDPTRYTLTEDGLPLALGFSIINTLRSSLRNNKDLNESLEGIIEPIAALDKTADVIMAAITIASLDESCSREITTALIYTFVGLQNPNAEDFSVFVKFARKIPDAYMQAAFNLCLENKHLPNVDWVGAALQDAKTDDIAWPIMSDHIRTWLSHYSLSQEYGMPMHLSGDSAQKMEERRKKRQSEINKNLRSLSPPEQELLNSLTIKDDGDLGALSNYAFNLMAGKSLAGFAESLIQWSFANALNTDINAPFKNFMNLVRFNRIDWHDTRQAIHSKLAIFKDATASQTGKWVLVKLLRATGDVKNGVKAETLAEQLTADRPKIEGWRLVEDYCATDPCDPKSNKPDNIAVTAKRYRAIDVSTLRNDMSNTEEDHFFDMARPGLARFEADTVIAKHKEFAADVARRDGFPLRQGILELRHQSALLIKDNATALLKLANVPSSGADEDDAAKEDRWLISQFRMLIAFPHLNGLEQLESLLSYTDSDDILSELMNVLKDVDEQTLDVHLEKACQDNDEHAQFRILAFALHTETPISKASRARIASLAKSPSRLVRAQALGLIAKLKDDDLIESFAKTDWSAKGLDSGSNYYEIWYGSEIILTAAERSFITYDEALDHMSSRFLGEAASRLSKTAVSDIALRIDVSIKRAVDFQTTHVIPEIEHNTSDEHGLNPPLFNLLDTTTTDSYDPNQIFERLTETAQAFEERQQRNRDAFRAFRLELTRAEAQIILDNLSIEQFSAIVAANMELAEYWYDLLLNLPKSQLPIVHNLGLLLASALGTTKPDKAKVLIQRLSQSQPLVHFTFGYERVTLDAMSVWSGADHESLNELRFERLDKALNDHELSIEVLAAYRNSKHSLLERYVDEKLAIGEPSLIARALMISGFSNESSHATDVLKRYQDTVGFIGQAHKAASYAYERNVWARCWFEKMCKAESYQDFWRYAVLFTKIVDGRFSIWRSDYTTHGEPLRLFGQTINNRLENRIKRWKDHRQKTLFGEKAPPSIFLQS